jgi:hypothetical protein
MSRAARSAPVVCSGAPSGRSTSDPLRALANLLECDQMVTVGRLAWPAAAASLALPLAGLGAAFAS